MNVTSKKSGKETFAFKFMQSLFVGREISICFGILLFVAFPCIAFAQTGNGSALHKYMQNLMIKFVNQKTDFSVFINNQSGIRAASDIDIHDLTKLPAPPTPDFTSAVQSFGEPGFFPPLHMLWLPQSKIGAVYIDEGSGACVSFILFTSDGHETSDIENPSIFYPQLCGLEGGANDDGGASGYLIEYKHRVIALAFDFEKTVPPEAKYYKFNLSWQELDTNGWSPVDSVEVSAGGPFNG